MLLKASGTRSFQFGPCPGVGLGPGAGCCHQPLGISGKILTFPLAKYNYLCYLFGPASPKEPLLQAEEFEKSCNRSMPQPQGFSRVLRSVWFDSVLPLLRCADTNSRLCHWGLQTCDSFSFLESNSHTVLTKVEIT